MRLNRLLTIILFLNIMLFGGIAPTMAEEITLPAIESGKVALTWNELKTLLDELDSLKRAAAQRRQPKKEDAPPIDYNLLDAQLRGAAEGELMRFDAEMTVHVLKSGWTTFRLFNEQIGIETVTITPKTAAIPNAPTPDAAPQPVAQLARGEKGVDMIARGPAEFAVKMTFYAPIKVDHLTYSLSLTPPASLMSRVTIEIPGKGVNLLTMTPAGKVTQTDALTTFQTVLGKNAALNLGWTIEKESGISRKSSADLHTLVSVEKTMLSMSSLIALNNLAALEQVELLLPKEVEILNVSSADIERWTAEQTADAQRLKLSGAIDARKSVNLTISYRAPLAALPANVAVPVAQVNGVGLVSGFVGVEIVGNLDVTPAEPQNKFAISPKNLPKTLWQSTSSPLLYGYEYHEAAFAARLDIKSYQEIQTVVANVDAADCVTHRTLEGKSITRVRYFIRNNDRQFLMVTLPEKSRLWQAFSEGEPVKPAKTERNAILIPMKKSTMQGEDLRSFSIEIGYVTEVDKLSLKGDLLNALPAIDLPISHLRWTIYLPENYEYTKFEGPVKQVAQFAAALDANAKTMIDIPLQGKQFLFEKFLLVDETPYVRGKYGQHLGDDIFLSVRGAIPAEDKDVMFDEQTQSAPSSVRKTYNQQVIPMNK